MKATLLSTLLVVLTSCSTSHQMKAPPPSDSHAETRKPGAPSELQAQLSERSAALTLTFDGAGENVSVLVSGLGDVVPSNMELMSGDAVKAGEVRKFEVPFTRGASGGHLVVSVEGIFAGGMRTRVHSVAVGDGVEFGEGAVQHIDGDVVKVMAVEGQ